MLMLLAALLTTQPCADISVVQLPGYECEINGLDLNFASFTSDPSVQYSFLSFNVLNNSIILTTHSPTYTLYQNCNCGDVTRTVHSSFGIWITSLTSSVNYINLHANTPSISNDAFAYIDAEGSIGNSFGMFSTKYNLNVRGNPYTLSTYFPGSVSVNRNNSPFYLASDLYSSAAIHDQSSAELITDWQTEINVGSIGGNGNPTTITPEPTTWVMMLTGMIVLSFIRRKVI